jgi:hypothetical protein
MHFKICFEALARRLNSVLRLVDQQIGLKIEVSKKIRMNQEEGLAGSLKAERL